MNIKEYDGNENNPENRFTGLNQNIKDDSWEAQEEKRIEAERREQERLATIEAQRLEKERKAQVERRIKQIRQQVDTKKKELAIVDRKYYAAHDRWHELWVKDSTTPYTDDFLYQVRRRKELTDEIKDLEEEALKLAREVQ